MPGAIKVENISKRYHLGSRVSAYRTLRELVVEVVKKPFSRLANANAYMSADAVSTIWALKDVSFDVQAGQVVGVVRRATAR